MQHVTNDQALENFSALLAAAQHEPVMIGEEGSLSAVLLSASEYGKLRRMVVDEFQRFCDKTADEAKRRGMTAELFDQLTSDLS